MLFPGVFFPRGQEVLQVSLGLQNHFVCMGVGAGLGKSSNLGQSPSNWGICVS